MSQRNSGDIVVGCVAELLIERQLNCVVRLLDALISPLFHLRQCESTEMSITALLVAKNGSFTEVNEPSSFSNSKLE